MKLSDFIRHRSADLRPGRTRESANEVIQLREQNAMLLVQMQARTRELSEALDQVKATSEVLHVISNSPGDLQAVLGGDRRERRPAA
jgi:hypothetical protein